MRVSTAPHIQTAPESCRSCGSRPSTPARVRLLADGSDIRAYLCDDCREKGSTVWELVGAPDYALA